MGSVDEFSTEKLVENIPVRAGTPHQVGDVLLT